MSKQTVPSVMSRLAKTLAGGSLCLAAGIAFAGECPSGRRVADGQGQKLDAMYASVSYKTIQRAVHIHPPVTELIPTPLGGLSPLAAQP